MLGYEYNERGGGGYGGGGYGGFDPMGGYGGGMDTVSNSLFSVIHIQRVLVDLWLMKKAIPKDQIKKQRIEIP